MALILNIETATKNCSVSLAKDGTSYVSVEEYSENYSHAEKLHCFINYVLEGASLKLSDLDAISVSKGPGSYTGLRIGISAVKGLCFGLNIPLLAIDTLNVMAEGFNAGQGILIPMIDARRDEVYTAVFDDSKKKVVPTQAKILDQNSFYKYNHSKVYLFGDGARKAEKILAISGNYFPEFYPSARYMDVLSEKLFKEKKFENIDNFEPFYLKDFIIGRQLITPTNQIE